MESVLYSVVAMNNNIEPVQTQPSVAHPIPKWIPKWGYAALATILSRWWLSHHTDADVTLRAVVALVPIIFWFAVALLAERRMRLLDEMQRQMIYQAWFFAGIGMIFVLMALTQMKLAGDALPEWLKEWLNHGLGYQGTLGLMLFLLFVGLMRSNRRFL